MNLKNSIKKNGEYILLALCISYFTLGAVLLTEDRRNYGKYLWGISIVDKSINNGKLIKYCGYDNNKDGLTDKVMEFSHTIGKQEVDIESYDVKRIMKMHNLK